MRYIILIMALTLSLMACDAGQKKQLTPCEMYSTIEGAYATSHMEGTFTFVKNGLAGTIEILGRDFNDMTCTYEITDCEAGVANMTCDGAPYQSKIIVISPDSVQIGNSVYVKVSQ